MEQHTDEVQVRRAVHFNPADHIEEYGRFRLTSWLKGLYYMTPLGHYTHPVQYWVMWAQWAKGHQPPSNFVRVGVQDDKSSERR